MQNLVKESDISDLAQNTDLSTKFATLAFKLFPR